MNADKIRKISAWVLALLLAASFIAAGFPKIQPSESMLRRFANWGYSPEFTILIGVLETAGGILVLLPITASFGALIITVVMAGAIWTHVSTGIGSPLFAAIYTGMAFVLIFLRLPEASFLTAVFKRR